jgi:hypothetical protein
LSADRRHAHRVDVDVAIVIVIVIVWRRRQLIERVDQLHVVLLGYGR